MEAQAAAIDAYLAGGDTPSVVALAELGLSLETLEALRGYVRGIEDWQIRQLGRLFLGSRLNLEQAQYIVAPVAKRMSELEGPALGGFLSDVIMKWISGVTFTVMRAETRFSNRLEDLIAVIYSRVQYLLPWGLWATDLVIGQEATRRGINYDNTVKKLAYLADAGVPDFDALSLTRYGFERVDAARLSQAYRTAGGPRTGLDCLGWILAQKVVRLEAVLRGQDARRLAYRFFERLDAIRRARLSE